MKILATTTYFLEFYPASREIRLLITGGNKLWCTLYSDSCIQFSGRGMYRREGTKSGQAMKTYPRAPLVVPPSDKRRRHSNILQRQNAKVHNTIEYTHGESLSFDIFQCKLLQRKSHYMLFINQTRRARQYTRTRFYNVSMTLCVSHSINCNDSAQQFHCDERQLQRHTRIKKHFFN